MVNSIPDCPIPLRMLMPVSMSRDGGVESSNERCIILNTKYIIFNAKLGWTSRVMVVG